MTPRWWVSGFVVILIGSSACGDSRKESSEDAGGGTGESAIGGGGTGAGGAATGGGAGGNGVGGTGAGSGGTGGSESVDLTGAWYGMGGDGDHCFVVCENGRFFTGDRVCTDVDATDFDTFLAYATSDGTVELEMPSPACWLSDSPCAGSVMSWSVSGDDATVEWCGYTFVMSRTAVTSPLCDDPAREPC